jgi:hypothetical protein
MGGTIFTWLDRGFWLIWAGFPFLVWSVVHDTLTVSAQLAAQLPNQAACIARLPNVLSLHPLSQLVFWGGFAVANLVYVVLLAHAPLVIHRCARGQVLVDPIIGILQWIGMIIAGFPVLDLALRNLLDWTLNLTGDTAVFQPSFALELPVLGVGLLLLAISHAMRQAVALQRDAALTV